MDTDSTSACRAPARRSSSTSDLFGGIYARGDVAAAVSDQAWLQAMLDAEAALGGEVLHAAEFDVEQLGRDAAEHASPVVPLAGRFAQTHAGATSQDILDTAMMLVAKRALEPLLADTSAAADAAAHLAQTHRDTPVMGRTLLQDALPTSFGLKAAGWMTGIDAAAAALRETPLAVQMGGPVGHRDPAVATEVARRLGLREPILPWHTDRVGPARLAASLGVLAGALAKVARDVTLTLEVREGVEGRGASSAMAHKRNPVAAVSVLACTRRVPGLVATMLSSMEQEHERAAGAWQAEWGTMTDLLRLAGSAAAWARDLLEHLEVDAAAMRAGAGADPDLGASPALIERALQEHRRLSEPSITDPEGGRDER
jgi:3-carboxy-cis,cis-muconate cycloisomerase